MRLLLAIASGGRAGARAIKVDAEPDALTVEAAIKFLEEECALTAENIADVIERFPEVVGCSVEDQLQAAVDHLAKTSFIPKGKFRTKTVLRKPEFLGYNIDCTAVGSGSCAGECNRCWVRL